MPDPTPPRVPTIKPKRVDLLVPQLSLRVLYWSQVVQRAVPSTPSDALWVNAMKGRAQAVLQSTRAADAAFFHQLEAQRQAVLQAETLSLEQVDAHLQVLGTHLAAVETLSCAEGSSGPTELEEPRVCEGFEGPEEFEGFTDLDALSGLEVLEELGEIEDLDDSEEQDLYPELDLDPEPVLLPELGLNPEPVLLPELDLDSELELYPELDLDEELGLNEELGVDEELGVEEELNPHPQLYADLDLDSELDVEEGTAQQLTTFLHKASSPQESHSGLATTEGSIMEIGSDSDQETAGGSSLEHQSLVPVYGITDLGHARLANSFVEEAHLACVGDTYHQNPFPTEASPVVSDAAIDDDEGSAEAERQVIDGDASTKRTLESQSFGVPYHPFEGKPETAERSGEAEEFLSVFNSDLFGSDGIEPETVEAIEGDLAAILFSPGSEEASEDAGAGYVNLGVQSEPLVTEPALTVAKTVDLEVPPLDLETGSTPLAAEPERIEKNVDLSVHFTPPGNHLPLVVRPRSPVLLVPRFSSAVIEADDSDVDINDSYHSAFDSTPEPEAPHEPLYSGFRLPAPATLSLGTVLTLEEPLSIVETERSRPFCASEDDNLSDSARTAELPGTEPHLSLGNETEMHTVSLYDRSEVGTAIETTICELLWSNILEIPGEDASQEVGLEGREKSGDAVCEARVEPEPLDRASILDTSAVSIPSPKNSGEVVVSVAVSESTSPRGLGEARVSPSNPVPDPMAPVLSAVGGEGCASEGDMAMLGCASGLDVNVPASTSHHEEEEVPGNDTVVDEGSAVSSKQGTLFRGEFIGDLITEIKSDCPSGVADSETPTATARGLKRGLEEEGAVTRAEMYRRVAPHLRWRAPQKLGHSPPRSIPNSEPVRECLVVQSSDPHQGRHSDLIALRSSGSTLDQEDKKSRSGELPEELTTDLAEDLTENLAKDLAEDLAEDPAEDPDENPAEDPVEELAEELTNDLAGDLAEDPAEDLGEKLTNDLAEDLTEDLAHDLTNDLAEDLAEVLAEVLAEGELEEELEEKLEVDLAGELVEEVEVEVFEDAEENIETNTEILEDNLEASLDQNSEESLEKRCEINLEENSVENGEGNVEEKESGIQKVEGGSEEALHQDSTRPSEVVEKSIPAEESDIPVLDSKPVPVLPSPAASLDVPKGPGGKRSLSPRRVRSAGTHAAELRVRSRSGTRTYDGITLPDTEIDLDPPAKRTRNVEWRTISEGFSELPSSEILEEEFQESSRLLDPDYTGSVKHESGLTLREDVDTWQVLSGAPEGAPEGAAEGAAEKAVGVIVKEDEKETAERVENETAGKGGEVSAEGGQIEEAAEEVKVDVLRVPLEEASLSTPADPESKSGTRSTKSEVKPEPPIVHPGPTPVHALVSNQPRPDQFSSDPDGTLPNHPNPDSSFREAETGQSLASLTSKLENSRVQPFHTGTKFEQEIREDSGAAVALQSGGERKSKREPKPTLKKREYEEERLVLKRVKKETKESIPLPLVPPPVESPAPESDMPKKPLKALKKNAKKKKSAKQKKERARLLREGVKTEETAAPTSSDATSTLSTESPVRANFASSSFSKESSPSDLPGRAEILGSPLRVIAHPRQKKGEAKTNEAVKAKRKGRVARARRDPKE